MSVEMQRSPLHFFSMLWWVLSSTWTLPESRTENGTCSVPFRQLLSQTSLRSSYWPWNLWEGNLCLQTLGMQGRSPPRSVPSPPCAHFPDTEEVWLFNSNWKHCVQKDSAITRWTWNLNNRNRLQTDTQSLLAKELHKAGTDEKTGKL